MLLFLSIAIAHCLFGFYLLAFSRPFRTTVWGPMPPLATMQMFLLSMAFKNEFDPDKVKPLPKWLGHLLGYLLLAITGIAAVACWPFLLIKQRREVNALHLRLSEDDKQRDAEITAAYTARLPVEQDAKTFGELWKRHKGHELPQCIIVAIHTWDMEHLEGLSGSFCKFTLEGNTYVYHSWRGDKGAEVSAEQVRNFIESVQGYPLIRKRPAHLDRSFEFSGEVTAIKIVLYDPGEEASWLADTIEIESKYSETTCVHYVGSHTNSDSLRRENPCWLVGGRSEQVIADFARGISARCE